LLDELRHELLHELRGYTEQQEDAEQSVLKAGLRVVRFVKGETDVERLERGEGGARDQRTKRRREVACQR
jgi:hypothetical protein